MKLGFVLLGVLIVVVAGSPLWLVLWFHHVDYRERRRRGLPKYGRQA